MKYYTTLPPFFCYCLQAEQDVFLSCLPTLSQPCLHPNFFARSEKVKLIFNGELADWFFKKEIKYAHEVGFCSLREIEGLMLLAEDWTPPPKSMTFQNFLLEFSVSGGESKCRENSGVLVLD